MLDSYQIRAGRALLGATQQALATAAGISVASLNNIERNIAKPRASTLQILTRTFLDAGLSFEEGTATQSFYFSKFGRPGSYDALVTQEQLIRYFNPDSLLKIKRIIFFTFNLPEIEEPEIGIFLETERRVILFDHMQFGFHYPSRLEILGNAMLQIFTLYAEQIYFSPQHVNNPHQLKAEELMNYIKNQENQKIRHPQCLFEVSANWQEKLRAFLNIPDHPLKRLFTLLEHLADGR